MLITRTKLEALIEKNEIEVLRFMPRVGGHYPRTIFDENKKGKLPKSWTDSTHEFELFNDGTVYAYKRRVI